MIGNPFNTTQFNETPAGALTRLRYAVPAAETEEGKKREQAYYEALGRFVQMFAEVEKVLAETLWAYAGTDRAVSKIIFAGTQSDHAANYIKAITKALSIPQESQDDLGNVLQQFGVIRGTRNDILHYGAEFIAEGRATVSNAWKAKAEPTEFAISADDLLDMRQDLRKIIAHLGYLHLGRPWPSPKGLARVALQQTLHSPWRYKRPPQPNKSTKTAESPPDRKPSPKRPRQRRSSLSTHKFPDPEERGE